ncbi:TonB-linked outer membrane protein, SusC/RagA family [Saccharicrinis carchari]|uniref:TonB-linked outer membrane protein, SusC/RagA family n=1 Tax=Saccharicrinis carchari TaxID=1168039 RepID=A0A521B3W0_SACCC|nr:SusC/RagA family TonB-linked outer membrane protein [Saccharicrinis carchari]SMO41762.1 TonB-linked outer membrane protein, SusC/RagA family [Saccharicrinis carchari]
MEQKFKIMLNYRLQKMAGFFLLFSFALLVLPQSGWANDKREPKGPLGNVMLEQSHQVTTILVKGKVIDLSGMAVPGVNILEKGTTNGAITNFDGEYALEVSSAATLVFSFIGFQTQEVQVAGRERIDIVLSAETLGLDEVVVTAMGVVAEKKNLNFAVQAVNAEELTRDKQSNFVDALQGRVAGVEISGAGGSPSANSQIVIRGVSSIDPGMGNEPIFILNGMHVSGGASKAAEINPNDIENVTILKGAAAAALYGSEAANGAIMITTKSGKAGAVKVSLNSTVQIDRATRVPELQSTYLRGGLGVYRHESKGGWGPMKPAGTTTFDNVENYLENGIYQKYDLSVSGGSEKFTTYASASYSDHTGIVPEDYLKRFTVLLKSDYDIRKNLSLGLMANISNRESRGAGSMGSIYSWPIDNDMLNYKNADGSIRWLYVNPNNRYDSPLNPFWSRYEDSGKSESYRTLLQGTIKWSPIKNLDLTGRIGYDLTNSEGLYTTTPRWGLPEGRDQPTAEDLPHLGSMSQSDGKGTVLNFGGLAQYKYVVNEDFTFDLLAGVDFKRSQGRSTGFKGYHFKTPGLESFSNLSTILQEDIYLNRSRKDIYGIFGELKLDYRGIAHVGVTGRNDVSSTLAEDKNSYFYPSYSGGFIFTELLNINSNLISFGKIRANWAKVGKDTNPYKQHNYFKAWPQHPDEGYGVDPVSSGNPFLDPEFTTSWEVGADFRLFNDKTRLDFAYYSTFVDGQIVTVRVSPTTGNILQTRNEGDISNKGVEITWNQKILSSGRFSWYSTTNFAHNDGTVGDLPGDVKEIYHYAGQVGTIRPASYEHGPIFGVSGKDYLRNDAGQVIVGQDGIPLINSSSSLLIANREADFTIGFENTWQYANWSLSALISMRKGGDVVNGTKSSLLSSGMAKTLEDYRNRQIVVKGVVEQPDGSYVPNTKPVVFDQLYYSNYYAPVGTNFIEDGSLVRLANLTLAYDISHLSKQIGISHLKLSVSGRNLFLWTNYSGSDPIVNYTGNSGGAGTYGVDYLRTPNTRSLSFNISANF